MKLTILIVMVLWIVGFGLAPLAYADRHDFKDFDLKDLLKDLKKDLKQELKEFKQDFKEWKQEFKEYKKEGNWSSSSYIQKNDVNGYTHSVPEPTSLMLLGGGLAGVGIARRILRKLR